jgi:hypothetical protein
MYRFGKGEMGSACTDVGKVKWMEHVQIWEGEMAGACTDMGKVKWLEHI